MMSLLHFVIHPFIHPSYQRDNALLVLLVLLAHHGVALPRSSLAIGKDTNIVSLKGMQQHLLPNVLVHLLLGMIVDVLRLQRERQCLSMNTPLVSYYGVNAELMACMVLKHMIFKSFRCMW